MKPGERVDRIKEIAERMSSGEHFDRGEVDLVFDQFGFGTTGYGGNPLNYTRERASTGTDEQLAELSQYLNPPAEPDIAPIAVRTPQILASQDPWETDNFRAFLSHCTSHVDVAKKLRRHLAERDRGVRRP